MDTAVDAVDSIFSLLPDWAARVFVVVIAGVTIIELIKRKRTP